jgi:hypothetical protein
LTEKYGTSVLNELYESPPKQHGLRIFKFYNPDDMIAIEVVCEGIKIQKIRK